MKTLKHYNKYIFQQEIFRYSTEILLINTIRWRSNYCHPCSINVYTWSDEIKRCFNFPLQCSTVAVNVSAAAADAGAPAAVVRRFLQLETLGPEFVHRVFQVICHRRQAVAFIRVTLK